MRRRALCSVIPPSVGNDWTDGCNAVLKINADNGQLGIDVYNYMFENSVLSPLGYHNWEAKDSDNVLVDGIFDGITVHNARVTYASAKTIGSAFDLFWDGKGSWHVGKLYADGSTRFYDDD